MSKFTKGKWEVDDDDGNSVYALYVFDEGKKLTFYIVYSAYGYEDEEKHANARLIAAAPEMYELLEDIAWYLEQIADDDDENAKYANRSKALLARIDGKETQA